MVDNPLSEDYTVRRSLVMCSKVIYFGFNFLVVILVLFICNISVCNELV